MRLLIDTHVFAWLLSAPQMISQEALDALSDTRNSLHLSAISAFEVSNKVRLGKWQEVAHLPEVWVERRVELGIDPLAVTEEDLLLAGRMSWEHRDPFDRMLAAQAMRRGMTLVSADPVFEGLPGLILLRA